MISHKYIRDFDNSREVTGQQYVKWILSQPEGVTPKQVKNHFKRLGINSVRKILHNTPNVYVSHWHKGGKGLPQAVFKAVAEGEIVPVSAENLSSLKSMDKRLLMIGHVHQGLTVIRGPWLSNGRVEA